MPSRPEIREQDSGRHGRGRFRVRGALAKSPGERRGRGQEPEPHGSTQNAPRALTHPELQNLNTVTHWPLRAAQLEPLGQSLRGLGTEDTMARGSTDMGPQAQWPGEGRPDTAGGGVT